MEGYHLHHIMAALQKYQSQLGRRTKKQDGHAAMVHKRRMETGAECMATIQDLIDRHG